MIDPLNTCPKDGKPRLWYGRWKPFDILKGGEQCVLIVCWTTLNADGSGGDWFVDGTFGVVHTWNVEWTHWIELPDYPVD